jgi:hypothetical protein
MFSGNYTIVDNVEEVPDDCDFVAFSIFDILLFEDIARTLLAKSKFVFIDFNELTSLNLFNIANELLSQYSNLTIVSTVIPNLPSRIAFSGQWFMSPRNFYSLNQAESWAINSLLKLNLEINSRHRLYMFDCLLGTEKKERNIIERMYKDSAHRDKIFFSYYRNNIKNGVWDFSVDSITSSAEITTHELENFAPSVVIPFSIYNQSYYSIVSETVAFNDYNFYTEKIAKPILAKRPFVSFAGKNYLKNLRALGFKTFDSVIDESYDSESNTTQRFCMAWHQVEKLMSMDPVEIYHATEHIRNHNYHLFRSTDWTASAKKLIDNLRIDGVKTTQ